MGFGSSWINCSNYSINILVILDRSIFIKFKWKSTFYDGLVKCELFQGKKDSYRDIVIINALHAIQLIKPNLSFDNYFEQLSYALDNNVAINHLKKLQK